MPRAVIFDMDNVLFPTEGLKFKAYQRVFEEHYGITLQDAPERVGLSERDAMAFFLRRAGLNTEANKLPSLIEAKRAAYLTVLQQENLSPYPGVRDLLQSLQQTGAWKMGLATQSNRVSTDVVLARFGFRCYFDSVLSAEDVSRPKPDPEIYLTSAKKLEVDPACCVVIEDSPTGLESARRAGMRTVAITNTLPPDQLTSADLVIGNFDLHPEQLGRLLPSVPPSAKDRR